MLRLRSDRLTIDIQKPGEGYERARFAWNGICEQIVLDGSTTFLSREATDDEPGTEGVGLIDEFGIQTPIGFYEARVGDWFPKIGVGFLQKTTDDAYDFMRDYPIRPAQIDIENDRDTRATFRQACEGIGGWGWNLHKALSIHEERLTIDYSLENTGDKRLATEQYNHNFLAINGQVVGLDYRLTTSFPLQCEVVDGGIQIEGQLFELTEIPTTYIYALQTGCTGLHNVEWELLHRPSGHGVRVKERSSLFKFAVWAKSHVISPEFFVWVDVQPGETQSWQREYTFF